MKSKRILISLIVISLIFVALKLYFKIDITIPCVFHELTGFYCPGCGTSRMIKSLLNLDFYQAFRYNEVVFCLLPFIIVLIIQGVIAWINNSKNYLYKKIPNFVWYAIIVILIIFDIMRNISLFDYLKPILIK